VRKQECSSYTLRNESVVLIVKSCKLWQYTKKLPEEEEKKGLFR